MLWVNEPVVWLPTWQDFDNPCTTMYHVVAIPGLQLQSQFIVVYSKSYMLISFLSSKVTVDNLKKVT
jgi:hypothetical protein